MKYLPYILLCLLSMVSCQIEDKNAPKPEDTFIKYYGELTSYEAKDIEIYYDASGQEPQGFVVFGTKKTQKEDIDYFVMRTDLQGILIDSTSFGYSDTLDIDRDGKADDWTGDGQSDRFRADEIAGQIQYVNGFGYAIVGSSSVTINPLGVSDWRWLTYGFLDENLAPKVPSGEPLNAKFFRNGATLLNATGNDIIQLASGDFLIVGAREVSRVGATKDFDNYYLKLTASNDVIFEKKKGIAGEDDILARGFENENGNLAMIGTSNRPSAEGENEGNNGANVLFLETDPNGTFINSVAHGLDDPSNNTIFDEEVSNVIKSDAGYTVVGTSNISGNQQFAFLMTMTGSGDILCAQNHNNSVYGSVQTIGQGVTLALNNDLILLGQYPSLSYTDSITGANVSRGGEGMFVKFNQSCRPIAQAESFFGLAVADGNDMVVDAVTLPDGKIVAVANVDFGGGVKLISIIKLNDDGSLN